MPMGGGGGVGGGKFEHGKGIEKGKEKLGDPSQLNDQEVSVVDMFAEGYNPGIPAGGGGQGDGDDSPYADKEGRKKAKRKFEGSIGKVINVLRH